MSLRTVLTPVLAFIVLITLGIVSYKTLWNSDNDEISSLESSFVEYTTESDDKNKSSSMTQKSKIQYKCIHREYCQLHWIAKSASMCNRCEGASVCCEANAHQKCNHSSHVTALKDPKLPSVVDPRKVFIWVNWRGTGFHYVNDGFVIHPRAVMASMTPSDPSIKREIVYVISTRNRTNQETSESYSGQEYEVIGLVNMFLEINLMNKNRTIYFTSSKIDITTPQLKTFCFQPITIPNDMQCLSIEFNKTVSNVIKPGILQSSSSLSFIKRPCVESDSSCSPCYISNLECEVVHEIPMFCGQEQKLSFSAFKASLTRSEKGRRQHFKIDSMDYSHIKSQLDLYLNAVYPDSNGNTNTTHLNVTKVVPAGLL